MSSNISKINAFSGSLIIALTVVTGGLLYWVRAHRRRHYQKAAKVAKLIIYPIKSLGGIEVDRLQVTKLGVKYGSFRDRSWMLVTDEDRFITLRAEPSLALVKQTLHDNEVWVDGPDMPTLKIKLRTAINAGDLVINTKVWGSSTQGVYCGLDAEQWFSRYLNKPGTKLIQNVPGLELRTNCAERNGKIVRIDKYRMIYQDGTGLHIINEKSVEDLNGRLEGHRVSYKNFRPNILVTDCEPFEEDNWLYLCINGVELTFMKPCERCLMTTIDIETGVKSRGEPLETLRKYRLADESVRKLYGTSPLFGISVAPDSEGRLAIGDDVMVVRK